MAAGGFRRETPELKTDEIEPFTNADVSRLREARSSNRPHAGAGAGVKSLSRLALVAAQHLPRGYWRLMRFAAARDPALWDVPAALRFLPHRSIRADLREPVFMHLFRHGCFHHQVGEDLLSMCLLRPGDLVFDVGANIGYPAILFAHLVGLRGKVVAFEASPRAFRLLLRATEADANVACLHAAASDSVGERRFFETESLDTSSLEPVPGVEPCIVPTTTLDIVSARMGTPAFVKIDVEGHEPHVLRGMQALLGSEAPPALMFEALTSRALAESSAEIRELGKEQYSLFRIRGDGTIGSLEDPQGTNNYLALPGWCRERLGGLVQH